MATSRAPSISLRKKGLSKAAKKAGRVAAEGLIGIAIARRKGVVVEVNSETDFVARNDLFQGLVRMVANVALDVGADVEAIKAGKVGDATIDDAINSAIATVGENMTLRRAAQISVTSGVIGSYVHNSVAEGLGRIGVIVGLESPGNRRGAGGARPSRRDAYCRLQSAGGRAGRPRSAGRRPGTRHPGRQVPRPGQAGAGDRQDRRIRA